MRDVNNPLVAVLFIASNILFLPPLLLVYFVQLPFNYLVRRLFTPPPRRLRAKVHLTTIEPQQRQKSDSPKDTLLFIHGFPDSPRLWSPTVKAMTASGYRCVLVALPGCRGQQVEKPLSSDLIVDQLQSALRKLDNHSFTVIGHDFGALFALLLRQKYPSTVHRMVLVDVGNFAHLSWFAQACILSYQVTFLLCYCIGYPIGTFFLRRRLRSWSYTVRPVEEVQSDMAWPYLWLLSQFLKWLHTRLTERRISASSQHRTSPASTEWTGVRRDLIAGGENETPIPILYVYGRAKPFYFHDKQFELDVAQTPHGVVESMEAGHWLQLQRQDEWLSLVSKWLDSSKAALIRPR